MGLFLSFIFTALGIIGGLLLFLIASNIVQELDSEDKSAELESLYYTRQDARCSAKKDLLHAILAEGDPDWKNVLWERYNKLDREDIALKEQEVSEIIEARGYYHTTEDIMNGDY